MDSAPPTPTRVVTLDQLLAADRDARVVRRGVCAPAARQPPAEARAPTGDIPPDDEAPDVPELPPRPADAGSPAVADAAPPDDDAPAVPSRPRPLIRDPAEETRRLLDLWDDTKSRNGYGSTPP